MRPYRVLKGKYRRRKHMTPRTVIAALSGITLVGVAIGAGVLGAGVATAQQPAAIPAHLPYVLVEYAHNAHGTAQPEVISPSGMILVNSQGVIENSLAGPVGSVTQTDGLQEAVNYAAASGEDVYIEGGYALGRGNARFNNNVYFLNQPLRIPPAQDLRIDGGEAVINYNPSSGNAITINSCEDCHFRFGVVVTGATNGAAVKFQPTQPTEIDGLKVITDSTFRFSSIATSKPTGTSLAALALTPSSSGGSILWNTIDATATVGFQYNVMTQGMSAAAGVFNNRISVGHNHMASKATAYVGTNSSGNIFTLNNSRNGGSPTAVISYGTNNTYTLQSNPGFAPGRDIVFEPGSTGNLVDAVGPVSFTDHNPPKDNKIIAAQPGASAESQSSKLNS